MSISNQLTDSFKDRLLIEKLDKLHTDLNLEDNIPYFYGDSIGVVTIGKGHAVHTLEEALALPLYIGDRKASPEEIKKMYTAVSKYGKEQYALSDGIAENMPKAPKYKKFNEGLSMTDPDIENMFKNDVRAKLSELKKAFVTVSLRPLKPRFKILYNYPFPAQLALLDMAFNMGVAGLFGKKFGLSKKKKGYFNMLHSVRTNKFENAASESNRPQFGKNHRRNKAIHTLFMKAKILHESFEKELKKEMAFQ